MSDPEIRFWLALMAAGCLGGAIGLVLAGGRFWKGLLLAVVMNAAMMAFSCFIDNLFLPILGGGIAVTLVARAMKIPDRQSFNVILGVFLCAVLPLFLLSLLMSLA